MSGYFNFAPDLIIEATNACDRKCHGCYAPNVVGEIQELGRQSDLFLSIANFKTAIQNENLSDLRSVAIRGGEPSLHPSLEILLEACCGISETVFLETHGRWLLNPEQNEKLKTLSRIGIVAKISFDPMHELTVEDLKKIVKTLEEYQIRFVVAITAKHFLRFVEIRKRVPFLANELICFQEFATSVDRLIVPRYGVLGRDGIRRKTLTHRFETLSKEVSL
jgi:MoaA/NifB/PqqE/SkfB family radical SAM enzyme